MRKFTRCIALLMAFYVAIALQTASAQSVLDPNDPVITYDSTKPPVQPPGPPAAQLEPVQRPLGDPPAPSHRGPLVDEVRRERGDAHQRVSE